MKFLWLHTAVIPLTLANGTHICTCQIDDLNSNHSHLVISWIMESLWHTSCMFVGWWYVYHDDIYICIYRRIIRLWRETKPTALCKFLVNSVGKVYKRIYYRNHDYYNAHWMVTSFLVHKIYMYIYNIRDIRQANTHKYNIIIIIIIILICVTSFIWIVFGIVVTENSSRCLNYHHHHHHEHRMPVPLFHCLPACFHPHVPSSLLLSSLHSCHAYI